MLISFSVKQHNYSGGSCYHASMGNCFIGAGYPEFGNWWTDNYRGGETTYHLHKKLETNNIPHVYTENGDPSILYESLSLGIPCAITWKSSHACCLVHIDKPYIYNFNTEQWIKHPNPVAIVADPNYAGNDKPVSLNEFLRKWRYHSGGAVSPRLPL